MAPLLSSPAAAESAKKKLELLEGELEQSRKQERALDRKAEKIGSEIAGLQGALVEVARDIQGREAEISAIEDELARLGAEAVAKRARLARQDQQVAGTLAVLQRVALHPTATLIVAPGDPNQALRSALLLRSMIPRLEQRSAALRDELDTLSSLGDRMRRQRSAMRTAALSLDRDQRRAERLLTEKRRLAARTESDKQAISRRMARLGREAKTLRDLIARLRRESLAKPTLRPDILEPRTPSEREQAVAARPGRGATASPVRGKMQYPARGRVTGRFGESNEVGRSREGVMIRTRPAAQVVAPFDGKVVFAGPYRGYGQILIIAHGERYHTLLAGFSRIDSAPGQRLLAGEPVGVMGNPENGNPFLYMELREKGRPINPLPWLAASN
ncbi:MAG: peptidoglycan DD-metalloendopeptidase family protein [Alphaproteobacteria bacterium]|nr:peptidoglycan DD-metalloendopeptidase family protein [Alphaproteobacteria bacterium]